MAQAAIIKKMLMERLGKDDYYRFTTALYMSHKPQITKYIITRILDNEDMIGERLYEVINYAFCWDETLDGHEFWRKRDQDWREYISLSPLRPEFRHVFKKRIG